MNNLRELAFTKQNRIGKSVYVKIAKKVKINLSIFPIPQPKSFLTSEKPMAISIHVDSKLFTGNTFGRFPGFIPIM